MTMSGTTSPSNTPISETKKLKGEKFALLAMVGRVKKALSQSQDEADFYSTFAIETLAALKELQSVAALTTDNPSLQLAVSDATSRQLRLMRALLTFSPSDSASQDRCYKVLTSDGLAMTMATTDEGYLTPSGDLILENVERIIEATKAESLRP